MFTKRHIWFTIIDMTVRFVFIITVSMMFPVYLYLAARRLTSSSIIPKRAAMAEKDRPISICSFRWLARLLITLSAMSVLSSEQQKACRFPNQSLASR